MTEQCEQLIRALKELATQYRCPWGDPGSNPDYFSPKQQALIKAVIRELRGRRQSESATK
jgi:hypothetical protein